MVTDRNRSVLAKEYFDLPVTFERGQDRIATNQVIKEIIIPRARDVASGNNSEVPSASM